MDTLPLGMIFSHAYSRCCTRSLASDSEPPQHHSKWQVARLLAQDRPSLEAVSG